MFLFGKKVEKRIQHFEYQPCTTQYKVYVYENTINCESYTLLRFNAESRN